MPCFMVRMRNDSLNKENYNFMDVPYFPTKLVQRLLASIESP
jgi:hypothetical protein